MSGSEIRRILFIKQLNKKKTMENISESFKFGSFYTLKGFSSLECLAFSHKRLKQTLDG